MFRHFAVSVGLTGVLTMSLWSAASAAQDDTRATPAATIVDLGPSANGDGARATGLNNRGEVIGMLSGSGTIPQISGADWQRGSWVDLAVGEALAINDQGQIAGYSAEGDQQHATIWTPGGRLVDLGGVLGSDISQATAINQRGQIAGFAQAGGAAQAFVWLDGRARALSNVGSGSSYAYGLNDDGEVVGESSGLAVEWDASGNPQDLGAGASSMARAINATGEVVGQAGTHAFAWSPDTGLTVLSTPAGISGSLALAINNSGDIAGNVFTGSGFRGVVWDNSEMCDLNSLLPAGSGWEVQSAVGINASGQITGDGLHNGVERAYLLTPGRNQLQACTSSSEGASH